MDNYEKSNSITAIPKLSFSAATRKLYKTYRELDKITEKQLQNLSNAIFADMGLRALVITFAGRRPHSNNGSRITKQTLGVHKSAMFSQSIQIYAKTAARQQAVKPKTAISTLIHEINHNFDYNILKLAKSIHSKGFYLRLKQVEQTLAA
jgi:hypothetical protein